MFYSNMGHFKGFFPSIYLWTYITQFIKTLLEPIYVLKLVIYDSNYFHRFTTSFMKRSSFALKLVFLITIFHLGLIFVGFV